MKNALVLCMITLVAGIALGGVYEFTKSIRAEKAQEKKLKACQAVLDQAEMFDLVMVDHNKLESQLKGKGLGNTKAVIDEVLAAKSSSGERLGYVMTITEKEGYGGDITFMVGIKSDGSVNGISILTISETPGLGMKAAEQKFLQQFSNKKVKSFSYIKGGATNADEIDAISGATITTNAMVNGTNTAVYCYQYLTEDGNEVADE